MKKKKEKEYSFVSKQHKCEDCGSPIKITDTLDSGATRYIWQCTKCGRSDRAGVRHPLWVRREDGLASQSSP